MNCKEMYCRDELYRYIRPPCIGKTCIECNELRIVHIVTYGLIIATAGIPFHFVTL